MLIPRGSVVPISCISFSTGLYALIGMVIALFAEVETSSTGVTIGELSHDVPSGIRRRCP